MRITIIIILMLVSIESFDPETLCLHRLISLPYFFLFSREYIECIFIGFIFLNLEGAVNFIFRDLLIHRHLRMRFVVIIFIFIKFRLVHWWLILLTFSVFLHSLRITGSHAVHHHATHRGADLGFSSSTSATTRILQSIEVVSSLTWRSNRVDK
jgi:hypothetical protein